MEGTIIMLPSDLKMKAANQAKNSNISLGEYIRESLRASLGPENQNQAATDSLFLDDAIFNGRTPDNIAAAHDEYLYGDEK